MSLNKYDPLTGTLTTLANGQRIWLGTKAAHDAAAAAGTLPTNCLIAITDDGDITGVVDAVENGNMNPVTSNAVYDSVANIVNNLANKQNKSITLSGDAGPNGKTYNVSFNKMGEFFLCFEGYGTGIPNVYVFRGGSDAITDIVGDHSGTIITNITDTSFTAQVKRYYGTIIMPIRHSSTITVTPV